LIIPTTNSKGTAVGGMVTVKGIHDTTVTITHKEIGIKGDNRGKTAVTNRKSTKLV